MQVEALEVVQAMGQEGVAPDVITNNALVSSSEKRKQPEQALSVFQAMRQHVVAPDIR